MSFESKDPKVRDRQLKVQKLSIPFTITAHATPASVILLNDEPSIMFLKSEGVDQIAAALQSGDVSTVDSAPNDANGILSILIKSGEVVSKIVSARMASLATGVDQPLKRGLASGLGLTAAGDILLTLDSSVDHSTTNVSGSIEVEYIVS